MLSKNELKYIQSLCQKKQRDAEKLFVAEGVKLLNELLNSDFEIQKIYATADWIPPDALQMPYTVVPEHELKAMSSLQTPHQVLAIVSQKTMVAANGISLGLVLDGIQDPGNMGTLIRIADWFGITHIIASTDCVELYNPKVVQATMGSLFRVQLSYQDLSEFLANAQVPVYGALLEGQPVNRMSPVSEGLLVIGNESKGIRLDLLSYITSPVTIPRLGGAESLNAAVAAGIILSHLRLPNA